MANNNYAKKIEILERISSLTEEIKQLMQKKLEEQDITVLQELLSSRKKCMDEFETLKEEMCSTEKLAFTVGHSALYQEYKDKSKAILERIIKEDYTNTVLFEHQMKLLEKELKEVNVDKKKIDAYAGSFYDEYGILLDSKS